MSISLLLFPPESKIKCEKTHICGMRYLILSAFILVTACGRLSDEERKKLRDGMAENKIVRVTDEEIVASALDEGRTIFASLEKKKFQTDAVDSIATSNGIRVHWTRPGDKDAEAIEQQLIEAYVSSIVTGNLQDNIQKLYRQGDPANYDSIVYSKPIVTLMADSVENLEGVWNIYMAKKDVVIALSKKK
jgi:hypothetical protein